MNDQNQLSAAEHAAQIDAFSRLRPKYTAYAAVLERILKKACESSIPTAVVQSRAKTVSSFAEKAVRKHEKYPDAVNNMTDLCGARVIVQTLAQVAAVRRFIEDNFKIVEYDDKAVYLGESQFGYRDTHYIIQLRPGADYSELGLTASDTELVAGLSAELQVRTLVQHAWADILHDRLYKAPLRFSSEVQRTGNLLAAIMEDGDQAFNRLAAELDGMLTNYTSYATREEVEREINIQRQLHATAPVTANKPTLALRLAQLIAKAYADYAQVVSILTPYASAEGLLGEEVRLELGYALCKTYVGQKSSKEYQEYLDYLRAVVTYCGRVTVKTVQDTEKIHSLAALALIRLGWASESIPGNNSEALDCYTRALKYEPSNPYYLATILASEIHGTHYVDLSASTKAVISAAIKTCKEHIATGTELPYAFFHVGRFNLLLGKDFVFEALEHYALGIKYCLFGKYAVPGDALQSELDYLYRINPAGKPISPEQQWVLKLLQLAQVVQGRLRAGDLRLPAASGVKLEPRILIVSGGAASLQEETGKKVKEYLLLALEGFAGTVLSGGTAVGVPGYVGEVAAKLKAEAKRQFRLIGYIPKSLPSALTKDARYDEFVETGDNFSPEQILQHWTDILGAGIKPEEVQLIGFGGGPLSSAEYHVALALGAMVNVVAGTGGTAQALLDNRLWTSVALNLKPIPADNETLRALFVVPQLSYSQTELEKMAEAFHANYLKMAAGRLPENSKPWAALSSTYKTASIEQARYAVEILKAGGFAVRPEMAGTVPIADLTGVEARVLERMAEMEHARWNVERLRDGWRYGKIKDEKNKLHPSIVPWDNLSEDIRQYDRDSVAAFFKILATVGLKVYKT